MITQEVLITNPTGLHARPAHKFIKLVKSFKSEVFIQSGENETKCDSIIKLLLLSVKPGSMVTVKVDGEDEQVALPAIVEFLEGLAKAEAEADADIEG
ncbi:MAG: HPr family phosphocarrier protein [Deltaproteobacteria bacterium]|nr:HPr family phosphocarrier protein [Deltaproteobacteria bacterium]